LAQSSEAEPMARILYGRELVIPLYPEALALTEAEVTALVAYLSRSDRACSVPATATDDSVDRSPPGSGHL
jgi:hypothetical protein